MSSLTESERLERNAYQLSYYHRNKKRINARLVAKRRAEFERDPEAFRAKWRAYYAENKEARNTWARENRQANLERERERDRQRMVRDPDRTRRHGIKRKFGITLEEYDAMVLAQHGVCAACGGPPGQNSKGKPIRLAIDHCHRTGRVRGLLCANCNVAIGMVDDDIEQLEALIRYLKRYA